MRTETSGRDGRPLVTIVYRFLPHYRVDFFSGLRSVLQGDGIDFRLVYGRNREVPRQDERDLSWATAVPNRQVQLGNLQFYWQPLPEFVYESDLVIMLQENKIISNYPVLFGNTLRGSKTAWWGHGINFQAISWAQRLGNRAKRHYCTHVDWWFAYTSGVADLVAGWGFPRERITVVENAIDTERLIQGGARLSVEQLAAMKRELRVGEGPIGIFCGGIYAEKRIPFLLQACQRIREAISGFEMIFVGAGPDAAMIQQFAAQHSWAHYVGPKFGDERIPYFKMADLFLMPGLVGLAVLDCFAMEVPMITTQYPFHSPEIEYLVNGQNGIITENSVDAYVNAVIELLRSKDVICRLKAECRESAQRYTMQKMVANFRQGVAAALTS